MSAIIECPACSTRYKMNKAIPEGGRSVKCARCGHQWRLVPDDHAGDELSQSRDEHGDSVAAFQSSEPQAYMPQGLSSGAEFEQEEDATEDWGVRREQFEAAMAGLRTEHHAEESGGDDFDLRQSWREAAAAAGFTANGQEASEETTSDSYAESDTNWADRIQQSWREQEENDAAAARNHDTESAVRHALKTALERPEGVAAPAAGSPHSAPFNDFWQGFSGTTETAEEGLAYGSKDADDVAAEMEHARRSSVIYDTGAIRHGYALEDEGDAADPLIQSDIAQAFSEPLHKTQMPRRDVRHDESLTDYDAGFSGDGFPPLPDDQGDSDYLDRDAAAIQAELENFGHHPDQPPQYGGLALVAAWAVFLSLVSGILLALVAFRENVMTAMPGTTRLYRGIGFDVTDRRIDFGDVSYRWTTANGKPMVEVRGQIINRTNRQIAVPRVQINVRDKETFDVMKAVAMVRNEPLSAKEVADFTIELVVQSKTVNQIELEFDRVR